MKENSSHKLNLAKSHFKNMFSMALIDSEVEPGELKLLYDKGAAAGFSMEEIDAIINNPQDVEFVMPIDRQEALGQILDLIQMMAANGAIDPREIGLCRTLALRMGLDQEFLEGVLPFAIDGVSQGKPVGEVLRLMGTVR